MSKQTITRDDLTGNITEESAEHKITMGDVSGTLDLSTDSFHALAALINGEGPTKLAALLAPTVPVTRGRKRGSGGSRDGKTDEFGITPDAYRTLAREHGITINARGRIPAEIKQKLRELRTTPGNAPANADAKGTDTKTAGETNASADANTPAATNASARRRDGKSADAAK